VANVEVGLLAGQSAERRMRTGEVRYRPPRLKSLGGIRDERRQGPLSWRILSWRLICCLLLLVGLTLAIAHFRGSPTRDLYQRPFAWDSVWNLPLAQSATLAHASINAQTTYLDPEDISIDPRFPVKTLNAAGQSIPVHVAPGLSGDGSWNHCATFLQDTSDRKTIVQGQPLALQAGGDPTYRYAWSAQSLVGSGISGCHGGSGLSGLGGDIRRGELPGDQPIQHALKVLLDCINSCSPASPGYQWPAMTADSGYNVPGTENYYNGSDPRIHPGTLLALPRDADLTYISEPDVRKVAQALQTYGAYVVDNSAWPGLEGLNVEWSAVSEFPHARSNSTVQLFRQLSIVTNSSPTTPGGGPLGSPRMAACAPPFADGMGGAPPGC
jgi:hypothetical protein